MLCGWWSAVPNPFAVILWLLALAPALELAIGFPTRPNARLPRGQAIHRAATWCWVPLQLGVVSVGLMLVKNTTSLTDLVTTAACVGLLTGTFGISTAHELMHREGRVDRLLAECLMSMVSYGHFCVEHVAGHHRSVATTKDTASARLGESIYSFFARTIVDGWHHAWSLERLRMKQIGKRTLCWKNRLVRYASYSAIGYAVAYGCAGGSGVALLAGQSIVAILLLEAVNYIQHYGLRRNDQEPVGAHHCWDCTYRLTNWLLLNLGLHADHHCHAKKRYTELSLCAEGFLLPAGYFAMVPLAFVPFLWRRVMDHRVSRVLSSELRTAS